MKKFYLLLGGWSRSKQSYKKLLQAAPKDAQIFVLSHHELDIHGLKDGVTAGILAFLEREKIDEVHLIGNSLGGALAIEFTAKYPKRVNHLTLVDSVGIPTGDTLFSMSIKLFRTHVLSNGLKKLFANIYSVGRILRQPILHLKAGTFAYTVDVQIFAKQITVPTTLLWGGNDVMIPVEVGEKLHTLIKGSKLIVFPYMDHDWPLHNPKLFWENIGD